MTTILRTLRVEPVVPAISAELSNIRIREAVTNDDLFAEIHELLMRYKVLFFRDQELAPADHVAFAERFGTLEQGDRLGYGALVVAAGSVLRTPPVPGAATAHSIDSMTDAIAFDDALRAIAHLPDPTVAIVGAGFTGIELALELRDRLEAHGRSTTTAPHVILIDTPALSASS